MDKELEESRKRMVRSKVELAAEVTDQASAQVDVALQHLAAFSGNRRIFNGFGVFADWSMVKGDVAAAHTALGKALALMREAEAPTRADYELIDP